MSIKHNGNEDNEELKHANSELLKRRAAVKAEEIKQHGDTFATIKVHLSKGEYDLARQLASSLRETLLFEEVVTLFKKNPETFKCEDCGGNMEGLALKRESLTWVRPHLCDSCDEKRKEMVKKRQEKAFADFLQQNMSAILTAIGVPALLLGASYNGFDETAVEKSKRSVMGRHGLYIHGDVGRGKSWLSAAVLKNIMMTMEVYEEVHGHLMNDINRFRELYRFVYAPWLLVQIKASYGRNDFQAEEEIIKEYTAIPVLLLDDLRVEKPTDWAREKLNTIVEFRNNKGLKTIYTSNKTPVQLQERLDERITSRQNT